MQCVFFVLKLNFLVDLKKYCDISCKEKLCGSVRLCKRPFPEIKGVYSAESRVYILQNQGCIICRIKGVYSAESGVYILQNQGCIFCRIRGVYSAESRVYILQNQGCKFCRIRGVYSA